MSIILGIVIIIGALWAIWKWAKADRWRRLRAKPLDPAWQAVLARRVRLYALLPPPLREELHGHIQVLLDEKNFEGCGGLVLTDEMKVTIAAEAGMLLLNRSTNYYPKLVSILVYPSAYVVKDVMDEHGFVRQEDVRHGESWETGVVILAWDQVARRTPGQNIVLHEFAHQLDQEDGMADGIPRLANRSRYLSWGRIFSKEFKLLRQQAARRLATLIDHHGATDPVEFFATATETFFENPRQMVAKHPELYEELKNYYQVDPVTWGSAPQTGKNL